MGLAKSEPDNVAMAVTPEAATRAFVPRLPVAVALSGGADSTALLVACARQWPGEVHAIHVHHGLQAAADGFERTCARLCESLRVPLSVERVDARHAAGESPEDAARRARYEALQRAAVSNGIRTVALAHHADDQVETVLLALSRGAGLAGLSGMRAQWERDGVLYARPWLEVDGAQAREWLRSQGIAWAEDPTNADERFTRNRIRAALLPALREAFPQYQAMFARSARHAAQAQGLLDSIAAGDLAATGEPPTIAALRALDPARRGNLLRYWLKTAHGEQATAAQLAELLAQVEACTTGSHRIHLKVARGFVTREEDRLRYAPG